MAPPKTAYNLFRSCGRPGCHACTDAHLKDVRKGYKTSLLKFLNEWRAYLNRHGPEAMRPKDVIDMVLGRPAVEQIKELQAEQDAIKTEVLETPELKASAEQVSVINKQALKSLGAFKKALKENL